MSTNFLTTYGKCQAPTHNSTEINPRASGAKPVSIDDYRNPDGSVNWEEYRFAHHNEYFSQDAFAPYNNTPSPDNKEPYDNNNTKKPQESYRVQKFSNKMFSRHFSTIRDFFKGLGFSNFERETMLKLLNFNSYYGANVFPSIPYLATDCQVSQRTVQYALAKAEDIGLLERQARHYQDAEGKVKQRSNLFRLDKLVLMVLKVISEHGEVLAKAVLRMLNSFGNFWQEVWDPDNKINLASCFVVRKLVT